VCVEVQGSDQDAITMIVTDPDGSSRTKSFVLDGNQASEIECSPVSARPATGVPTPPAWWREGRRTILKRGGRCSQTTENISAQDPTTNRPAGTYKETYVACRHSIPRSLFVKFGGNPAAPNPAESCSSIVSSGNPEGDGYSFLCSVFSARGKSGRPTRSSWLCERGKHLDNNERDFERAWTASRSPRSTERQVRTLARCLSRRPRR
jgi:hypothetical protein